MDYSVFREFGYEKARVQDRVREFRGDWQAYAAVTNFGVVLTHMTAEEIAELRATFEAVAAVWQTGVSLESCH